MVGETRTTAADLTWAMTALRCRGDVESAVTRDARDFSQIAILLSDGSECLGPNTGGHGRPVVRDETLDLCRELLGAEDLSTSSPSLYFSLNQRHRGHVVGAFIHRLEREGESLTMVCLDRASYM